MKRPRGHKERGKGKGILHKSFSELLQTNGSANSLGSLRSHKQTPDRTNKLDTNGPGDPS